MLPPPVNLNGIPLTDGIVTPAPSNRLTEYSVIVTTSSDLGTINHRIVITRCQPNTPPFVFEMLLTDEQYIVFVQLFRNY